VKKLTMAAKMGCVEGMSSGVTLGVFL